MKADSLRGTMLNNLTENDQMNYAAGTDRVDVQGVFYLRQKP